MSVCLTDVLPCLCYPRAVPTLLLIELFLAVILLFLIPFKETGFFSDLRHCGSLIMTVIKGACVVPVSLCQCKESFSVNRRLVFLCIQAGGTVLYVAPTGFWTLRPIATSSCSFFLLWRTSLNGRKNNYDKGSHTSCKACSLERWRVLSMVLFCIDLHSTFLAEPLFWCSHKLWLCKY